MAKLFAVLDALQIACGVISSVLQDPAPPETAAWGGD